MDEELFSLLFDPNEGSALDPAANQATVISEVKFGSWTKWFITTHVWSD